MQRVASAYHDRLWRWFAVALLILLGAVARTAAQPPTSAPAEPAPAGTRPAQPPPSPAAEGPSTASQPAAKALFAADSVSMTGDWGGLRPALDERGLRTRLYYNNTYQWNVRGGRDTTGRNGATIDWFVELDFERLGLIPGGRMCAHARAQWGAGVNPAVGSLWQVADDLDGRLELHLDQLWYEQDLFTRRLTLRIGYLDYQTIVDQNAYANSEDRQFLNQALDNNPLLPLQIGLGAAATVRPVEWLYFTAAAVDADGRLTRTGFDTAFHGSPRYVSFFEAGVRPALPNWTGGGTLPGAYRVGTVYDPRSRPIFEDPAVRPPRRPARGDDWGWYLSFDQLVCRENEHDVQGLGLFARYGWRRDDVNRVQHFWSAGAQYQGLIPRRDADVLGFAVAQGVPSDQFEAFIDPRARGETVYELYYAIEVFRWLRITPDVQYVSHPGGSDRLRDALVLGLRAQVSF